MSIVQEEHDFSLFQNKLKSKRGAFGVATRTRFRDITDGTSNTLVIGEATNSRPDAATQNEYDGTAPIWIRCQDYSDGVSASDDVHANSVLRYSASESAMFGTLPKKINGDPYFPYFTFSSSHEGGAQFCLADGSVRFLSETIDQTTYENLSTIQDGNVIGEF